jgi:Protein of unknown function (DUF4236)
VRRESLRSGTVMSFRFRKSVQLFPGVRLNFSPSGVSTTIGVRGAALALTRRQFRICSCFEGA